MQAGHAARACAALCKSTRLFIAVQDDPAFTPETVAKQSRAAQSLCLWARAMDTYHRVAAAVAPKRAKLRSTEAILAAADAQLHEKQARLRVTPPVACPDQTRVCLTTSARSIQVCTSLMFCLYTRHGSCSFSKK